VVASTSAWGDLIASVAGGHAQVHSIIADPTQDPHSYQADARTQLRLSQADLVVMNGGGYDDFVTTMLKAAAKSDSGAAGPGRTSASKPVVLDAVEISGYAASGGHSLNEHVWYDIPTAQLVVAQIASSLSALDPAHAADYAANAAGLRSSLDGLVARERSIAAAHAGAPVAVTEPVPLYLLDACGLVNKTPAGFAAAVENETDASPRDMSAMLALFSTHSVRSLVYNAQTAGPQTARALGAAKSAGIPAIPVTETMPAGAHFVGWMNSALDAIESSLSA
jgi:zinc/manganese transport system substrate-binding protein